MSESSDVTITFIAGRQAGDRMTWHESAGGPTATVSLTSFRLLFDAAGEITIDTTGDIDPGVLLKIAGHGPRGTEDTTTRVRLVARWAHQRDLQVGFAIDEPTIIRHEP